MSKNNDRIIILDVRSEREYLEGHIRNAINIPFDGVLKEEININNDKIVLVYCSRGGRSMRVAKLLSYKGFRVVNVIGGLKEYTGKNIIK
jgi:rhodanese-related sulfurtransferase